jgi:hypothetical protein
MNLDNLEFHELADLFPLLEGDELQQIADDIKANGFRSEPITLLGGKILDGRNRYNAAKLAGHKLGPDDVERFEEHYPGQDPVLFVVAKNLHRRHLTTGQRACLAAELYKCMAKRPVGQPKELYGIPDNTPPAKESLKKAAEVADVSADSAAQVLHIEKVAPEVAAEVKTGKKSLHKASQEVKAKQRRLAGGRKTSEQVALAREMKKFERSLGIIVNTGRAIARLREQYPQIDVVIPSGFRDSLRLAKKVIDPLADALKPTKRN